MKSVRFNDRRALTKALLVLTGSLHWANALVALRRQQGRPSKTRLSGSTQSGIGLISGWRVRC